MLMVQSVASSDEIAEVSKLYLRYPVGGTRRSSFRLGIGQYDPRSSFGFEEPRHSASPRQRCDAMIHWPYSISAS